MYRPQCISCRHFDGEDLSKNSCAAFPAGIPDAIMENRADHRRAFEGDGGIRYESIPGFSHPGVYPKGKGPQP